MNFIIKMFGGYTSEEFLSLKTDISKANSNVEALRHQYDLSINSLKKDIWGLKNPPQFKVGDKHGKDIIITKVNLVEGGVCNSWKFGWFYYAINTKTGESVSMDEYNPNCNIDWTTVKL